MHSHARSTFAATLALALSACATLPSPPPGDAIAIDRTAALESVNAFRKTNGRPALHVEERLMAAAETQSEAMAKRGTMDHEVAGALPDRVKAEGYAWSTTAENIARSYPDWNAAMAGWIGSPGHRRNLLNADVTEIGFAAARGRDGRSYWTQIFAKPRDGGSAF